MFINTEYYSELAREFKQLGGKYPYYDEYLDIYKELNRDNKKTDKVKFPVLDDMSYSAQEFALFWLDRFVNGFSVGGKPITGEHAFYLNGMGIDVTKQYDIEAHRQTKKKIGYRDFDFPSFWDEDYKYFWTCDIARFGMSRERYEYFRDNIMDFDLVEDYDYNLAGGLNHLWLKPRGVGASWKGAEKACHNLYLKPKSNTFIFAESKEYIGDKDGFFAKFNKARSFIQKNAWFLRREFFKESNTDFLYKTGWEEVIAGSTIQRGFQTTVAGVVVDGDSDKGRGKRGDAIFEEFGSFPTVDKVWNKYEQSAVEYGIVHGHARGFGTGGDSKKGKGTIEGYAALRKMFYDPKTYRIIMFNNSWEELGVKNGLGMFTPAYINITEKDNNGNSDKVKGKAILDIDRESWKESSDSNLFIEKCAELPYKPKEAFNAIGENIFNVALWELQKDRLLQTGVHNKLVSYGDLVAGRRGLEFVPNLRKRPYEDYPYTDNNKDSCVCVFQKPYRNKNGVIPDNLYRICVDPYRNGGTDGPSIGSIYVIENVNKYTPYKGDIIAAWYNGRPVNDTSEQNEFCKILYGLAEMYNAKIGLETGSESAIVSYAKNRANTDSRGRRLVKYLEEQFELAFNEVIATKKNMKKEFGMHMTSERRIQGFNYLNDWFNRPRGMKDGIIIRNIDFIFDMGLINEVTGYKGLNADRLSSLIIGAYYEKELSYHPPQHNDNSKFNDSFFNMSIY